MTDVPTPVTISVNGRSISCASGELVIEAAERAGHYVPRICYHPRMEPVGMCRMCLVEVDGPRGATLQPACYIKVSDGMSIVTDSEKVKKAQDGVLEFLLANHPLDCPVCDKGGECPLQDQTLAHGSGETRFIEEKRHFVKPIDIGALVLLDRERCIQCARCTRFSAEVSGDTEIAFMGRGDLIEVAPSPSTPFDSIFSGNTVQICPVGALTAKPYRFSARPWDLEQVESTCTTCAVGCRVAVQSSGNRLSRVLGVDTGSVNQGWLCDKGRFTLDAVDAHEALRDPLDPASRIREPLLRVDGVLREVSWGEALERAAALLLDASSTPNGVGSIGGAALTNEGAFAWQRFVRDVLGSHHLDAQYGDGLDGALLQTLARASIDDAATARVVVTITGDLREELPILFLRLRENIVRRDAALVEFASGPSGLRSLARIVLPVRPGETNVLARAIVRDDAHVATGSHVSDIDLEATRQLLGDRGEGVVFVLGRPNLAEAASVIEEAARTLRDRYPEARFLPALRRSNVMGALDMGHGPRLLAAGGYRADAPGRSALEQLEAMRDGEQSALLLLGGSLFGNVVDVEGARLALQRANVVAVCGHGDPTLAYADVVLPASVQHERSGTVTNIEGRVSSVNAKIVPPGSAWSDVAIAAELAELCGHPIGLSSIDEAGLVLNATTGYPARRDVEHFGDDGVLTWASRDDAGSHERRALDPIAVPGIRSTKTVGLAESAGSVSEPTFTASPSQPPTPATKDSLVTTSAPDAVLYDAYGLAVVLTRRLYDQGVAVQGSPALASLVARTTIMVHPSDLDRLGLVTGDEVSVRTNDATLRLRVRANDELTRGTLHAVIGSLDDNGECTQTRSLVDITSTVTQVKLATT